MGWKYQWAKEEYDQLFEQRFLLKHTPEGEQRRIYLYETYYEEKPKPPREESRRALEQFKQLLSEAGNREPSFDEILILSSEIEDVTKRAEFIFSWLFIKLAAGEELTERERQFVIEATSEEGLRDLRERARNFKPKPGWREEFRKKATQYGATFDTESNEARAIFDMYLDLPEDEQEKMKNVGKGFAKLFFGERYAKWQHAFGGSSAPSPFREKQKELDKLEADYQRAVRENSHNKERLEDLKYLYEMERKKIFES